jgi:hypothetical protein
MFSAEAIRFALAGGIIVGLVVGLGLGYLIGRDR